LVKKPRVSSKEHNFHPYLKVATKEPHEYLAQRTIDQNPLTSPIALYHWLLFLFTEQTRVYLNTLAIVFPFGGELGVRRQTGRDVIDIASDHSEHRV
jgi:hypothetical protein